MYGDGAPCPGKVFDVIGVGSVPLRLALDFQVEDYAASCGSLATMEVR
jgi:hypothetical protein